MSSEPAVPVNDGRNSDGTFGKGNRANPTGKPKGARHRTTLAVEALLEGEHLALTRKAIEVALTGDTVALRLCLDRIAPARKDAPVNIDLPAVASAADAVSAGSAVMAALGDGDISPEEAGRLMAVLLAQKTLIETCDLERRLIALEERNSK